MSPRILPKASKATIESLITEKSLSTSEQPSINFGIHRSEMNDLREHDARDSFVSSINQYENQQKEGIVPARVLPLCPHCTKVVSHGMNYAHPESAWLPGSWKQFPWLGVLALLTATIGSLGCMLVLIKSNDVSIDAWNAFFQPTVYLSICTALSNTALTYALYEGLVISFWRKACRGTTLTELHQHWSSGSSLWGATRGVLKRRGKTVAFACIMTVLSILRGPLVQRASSVSNLVIQQQGNLTIYSAIRLPFGYTGFDAGRSQTPSMMNPNFTDIVQAYTNRENITAAWLGCESTCFSAIKGFGFGVSCDKSNIPFSYLPYELDANTGVFDTGRPRTMRVFEVDAGQIADYEHGRSEIYYWFISNSINKTDDVLESVAYNGALLLNATFKATRGGSSDGSVLQHVCALRAGVVEYQVRITNETLGLRSSSWRDDAFLEDYGFQASAYNSPSNLAGFILAAKSIYQGSADMQFGGGVGWILNVTGASANRYLERADAFQNTFVLDDNITWRDPMEDMVNSMRELAFRTALQIAVDNRTYVNATQIVPFTGMAIKTVYTTNYPFMFGAIAVSLLGVFAVAPTFYGFWELGRSVTLSPLEIAKAFGAPLLRDMPGNRPAEDMLVWAEGCKIKYGDVGTTSISSSSDLDEKDEDIGRVEMGLMPMVRPFKRGFKYV